MKALFALALATLICATPALSDPNRQLTRTVALRLQPYNIHVDPEGLTTAQAAALHTLLGSRRGYLEVRRRARLILTSPRFRD